MVEYETPVSTAQLRGSLRSPKARRHLIMDSIARVTRIGTAEDETVQASLSHSSKLAATILFQ